MPDLGWEVPDYSFAAHQSIPTKVSTKAVLLHSSNCSPEMKSHGNILRERILDFTSLFRSGKKSDANAPFN